MVGLGASRESNRPKLLELDRKIESMKARAQSGELGGVTIVDGQMVSPGAPASKPDIVDQPTKLDALRTRGVLTDAEFAAEKAKLLAQS